MTLPTPKAKTWKRSVVLLLGLFVVAMSVTLFCLASDSIGSRIAKFVLLPMLSLSR